MALPTHDYFAGLDIGTTSTKVLVVDKTGKSVLRTSADYPLLTPVPGYAEQDPEAIINAVVGSLKDAVSRMPASGNLVAIGVSAAMHSVLMVDKNGDPISPLITWADMRSKAEAQALKARSLGEEIYLRTGTPIHPMSPLCKALWYQNHDKARVQSAAKWISIKEYVIWKLFNAYLIDHSIASATGLFDIHTRSWYKPALDTCGLKLDQLSEVVETHHVLQGMDTAFAAEIGLDPQTPFVIGASDGCLANRGVGALAPDEAALTIGTSGAIRVTTSEPSVDPGKRLFTYILDDQRYVVGGAINNGAILLQWFRNQLLKQTEETPVPSTRELLRLTAAIPPGSEGLLCIPYLLGERAPYWRTNDFGIFWGVQFHHTSTHFLKAIIEGISMTLWQVAKAIEETCGSLRIIHVNGGFARSPEWLQIVADVFNKELQVKPTVEASALGAAMMAMDALKFPLLPQANTAGSGAYGKRIAPDPDTHYHYTKLLGRFTRIYDAVSLLNPL